MGSPLPPAPATPLYTRTPATDQRIPSIAVRMQGHNGVRKSATRPNSALKGTKPALAATPSNRTTEDEVPKDFKLITDPRTDVATRPRT